ncbi:MAG: hypothetical protein MZW92_38245 [Comamonadaceae bacterium]|nr:hypothetical protein [Comamonadaceae bacterium]
MRAHASPLARAVRALGRARCSRCSSVARADDARCRSPAALAGRRRRRRRAPAWRDERGIDDRRRPAPARGLTATRCAMPLAYIAAQPLGAQRRPRC